MRYTLILVLSSLVLCRSSQAVTVDELSSYIEAGIIDPAVHAQKVTLDSFPGNPAVGSVGIAIGQLPDQTFLPGGLGATAEFSLVRAANEVSFRVDARNGFNQAAGIAFTYAKLAFSVSEPTEYEVAGLFQGDLTSGVTGAPVTDWNAVVDLVSLSPFSRVVNYSEGVSPARDFATAVGAPSSTPGYGTVGAPSGLLAPGSYSYTVSFLGYLPGAAGAGSGWSVLSLHAVPDSTSVNATLAILLPVGLHLMRSPCKRRPPSHLMK